MLSFKNKYFPRLDLYKVYESGRIHGDVHQGIYDFEYRFHLDYLLDKVRVLFCTQHTTWEYSGRPLTDYTDRPHHTNSTRLDEMWESFRCEKLDIDDTFISYSELEERLRNPDLSDEFWFFSELYKIPGCPSVHYVELSIYPSHFTIDIDKATGHYNCVRCKGTFRIKRDKNGIPRSDIPVENFWKEIAMNLE